jgi:hypothetical protein
MKNMALIVSGVVFLLVAVLHVARLALHIEIMAAGRVLPMGASILGFLFASGMALWMFAAGKGKS